MRITNIEATNVLAIKDVNLKLRSAVSLICGRNGSLKSSLYDVISMAVAKEPMRAVIHKKDYAELVHDGAKAGGGLVMFNDDPDQAYSFNLPKGEFKEPETPLFGSTDSMRVVLNGQNFARMDTKARLTFLRTLTKIRPTKEIILPMLEKAGADAAHMEQITPLLRSGFAAAEEFAKDRALDAKRLWCSTTGKKAYGKDVADAWEAPMPDAPTADVTKLKTDIAAQETSIATCNQSLGQIQQLAAQVAADAATREKLKGAAAKVDSIAEQLERSITEGAAQQLKVEALRERAQGTVRVGLIHDMARFIYSEKPKDAARALAMAEILGKYTDEHGPVQEGGKVDAEAKAALPEQEKALQLYQNQAQNLRRDLDSARQAKGQYDALAPADDARDSSKEIAEINGLLEKAKAEKMRLQNLVLDVEAAIKNRAEAEKKNADAKKHHADVAQWLLVAAELAPDGIPGRLLAEALKPVSHALAQTAADNYWPLVVIQPDMEIMCGGRRYDLQSESFKWRADAMIAAMVAIISGIKIMLLDRFDVLDLQARVELFDWIDIMVEEGELDSVMIFGTLKALPAADQLPESFTAYWVENGTVAAVNEQTEAVAA